MPGPLNGIKVIDLTTAVLGPLATQLLGDLGADVVKIESPAGDDMRNLGPARHPGMSAMFLNLNRNKRSVVLDLKQSVDHAALLRLIAGADVLVHNMRPQAATRLKISYSDLAAGNPRLIYASACGYSEASPDRDRPAFDDIMQGATGIAGAFLRSDGQPRYAPFLVADKVVGHVLASAIGFALLERAGSGVGQEVKVPMFETMVSFNLVEHLWGGVFDPPMHGLGYSRIFVPERRPFQTKDGFICVTATTDQQWRRLFLSVGHPELADDERFATMAKRTFHFAEAYQYLRTAMLERPTTEWKAIFDLADLPNGPANSLDDLLADPHLNQSGFFQTYEHPTEGSLRATAVPVIYSRSPGGLSRPPPRLGEHTKELLVEAAPTDPQTA
jgi:crotonobetainyl-CoA:carnitine CoA-transferase CaiB-like acyl-CoA transferase